MVVRTPENFGGQVGQEARHLMCNICRSGFSAYVIVRDEVDARILGPPPCSNITIKLLTVPVGEDEDGELHRNASKASLRHFKVASIAKACNFFDETIYLDNDIFFTKAKALFDFFEVMHAQNRSVGARRLPYCWNKHDWSKGNEGISDNFCEHNGGFLMLRCHDGAQKIMQAWLNEFEKETAARDQQSLRKVLYKNRDQLLDLPSRYNCRPSDMRSKHFDPKKCLVIHNHNVTHHMMEPSCRL